MYRIHVRNVIYAGNAPRILKEMRENMKVSEEKSGRFGRAWFLKGRKAAGQK
jgi:hypothetical protein